MLDIAVLAETVPPNERMHRCVTAAGTTFYIKADYRNDAAPIHYALAEDGEWVAAEATIGDAKRSSLRAGELVAFQLWGESTMQLVERVV
jgi:hypothetical protein